MAQNARRRDVPVARRKTCRLRAAGRASCALQDAPVARRKTRRLCAAIRAACTPEDVPLARRKTCRLHAGRRADCTPQDVPGARRSRRAGEASRPVRPFSSRSGLPELHGRAAEREMSRPAWPPGAQGVPRAPKGTCQTLEPKLGRREAKVPPGFAVLFLLSLSSQKRSRREVKHTKKRDASVRESGARARARWPSALGNFIAKPKHT